MEVVGPVENLCRYVGRRNLDGHDASRELELVSPAFRGLLAGKSRGHYVNLGR